MTKNEKLALSQLQKQIKDFEHKKYSLHQELLKNSDYKNLYSKKQTISIEIAKQEKPLTQTQEDFKEISNSLDKIALKLSSEASILSKEHMCSLCFDSGFIDHKPCSCLKQVMSEMLMKQSGLDLQTLSIPQNDFSLFKNPAEIQKIYAALDKWILNFKDSKIKNWGFMGNTGTGKTHLMLYILKNLISHGHFVHFTTAFNLTKELLSQHTDFEDKNRDYISKYIDCEILFIDDMGTEPKYNNVNENYLYLILNQRMIENKPIIFSSNFDLAGFEDFYGERIFSRLINKRTSKTLWFDGLDLRLKN
jgi:DNA replication protein DnaC